MDSRERRIGENEILFRHVNTQIRELDARFEVPSAETYEFLCECGNRDCAERIRLGIEEYERIHVDPVQFAVVPGHEIPDVESVVERRDGYLVIRKDEGGPAELAAEHDEP